jgi:hypothetical protein
MSHISNRTTFLVRSLSLNRVNSSQSEIMEAAALSFRKALMTKSRLIISITWSFRLMIKASTITKIRKSQKWFLKFYG